MIKLEQSCTHIGKQSMNDLSSVVNTIDESFKLTKLYPSISYSERIKKISELINPNDKNIVLNGIGENLLSINMTSDIINHLNLTPDQIKIILNVDPKDYSGNKLSDFDVIVDRTAGFCNWYNFYSILSEKKIDWKTIKLEYHLLSLSNRPTIERALYTKDVLDIFKEKALVSFGVSGEINRQMIDILKPYQPPITVDINQNITNSSSCFSLDTHRRISMKLFSCLFKLVLETTIDELFITEKTFKAFAWHQIPIFVANERHTQALKDLGFDVFDDLFYDLLGYQIYDTPATHGSFRIKVMSLLLKIREKYPTLPHLEDLRNSVWKRLAHNNNLLSYYVENDITKDMLSH